MTRPLALAALVTLACAPDARAQEQAVPSAAPYGRGSGSPVVHIGAGSLTVGGGARLVTTYGVTADSSDGLVVGDGTLVFTGAGDQTFATAAAPQAITNLELAKTGGTVQLGMDLNVTGVLTANGGTITPNGYRAALAATLNGGGQIQRLAALRGDGSTLGGPLVFERPHRDGEGWRMIAAPFADQFTSLNDDFHTQGAANTDYPGGGGHLYGYNAAAAPGSRYVAVADYATPMAAGRGYFFYAYGTDPGTGGPALPTTWDVSGVEPAGTVSAPLAYGTGDAEAAWNLLGNPYAAPIDWHAAQSAYTLQAAYAVWDPAANSGLGNYAFYSSAGVATGRAGRHIPQAQGFWAQTTASSPPTLTFDRTWKRPDSIGVYVGRPASAVPQLRLRLAGQGLEATEPVALFLDGGAVGADLYDGSWLRPMSTDYAAAYFVRGEDSARLVFEGRPVGPAVPSLSVGVEATRAGTYTLAWPTPNAAPAGPLTLVDLVTGATVDMRQQSQYSFALEAAGVPLVPGGPLAARSGATAPRFSVVFDAVTGAENPSETPSALALAAPSPNPVRTLARVRYGLPEAGRARLVLYDALGRTAAVLAEGDTAAGWHSVTLDASALAAGVYVLRLETAGGGQTARVTIAR